MITTISGIPCLIRNIHITGDYQPARVHGDPNDCYEAEFPEVEFDVCDRRGRPAPWLEVKMTRQDISRIENLILNADQ